MFDKLYFVTHILLTLQCLSERRAALIFSLSFDERKKPLTLTFFLIWKIACISKQDWQVKQLSFKRNVNR